MKPGDFDHPTAYVECVPVTPDRQQWTAVIAVVGVSHIADTLTAAGYEPSDNGVKFSKWCVSSRVHPWVKRFGPSSRADIREAVMEAFRELDKLNRTPALAKISKEAT